MAIATSKKGRPHPCGEYAMSRITSLIATALLLAVSPAFGQVVVTRPIVTYYTPAVTPVAMYSTPTFTSSTVLYDVPATVSRPVPTYYAPADTVGESGPVA